MSNCPSHDQNKSTWGGGGGEGVVGGGRVGLYLTFSYKCNYSDYLIK